MLVECPAVYDAYFERVTERKQTFLERREATRQQRIGRLKR